ncbi:MAG TPA: cyclophilin-like fold protein [bacterium]
MRKMKLTIGTVVLEVQLKDNLTADALFKAAPFESTANTWGDEVYFSTPAQVAVADDARTVMEPGEIAFWPPGNAIAIGFGPTPVSRGKEIRLASPANVWATATGDVKQLKSVRAGSKIKVEVA